MKKLKKKDSAEHYMEHCGSGKLLTSVQAVPMNAFKIPWVSNS
jgi:hypothetical protein